MNELVFSWCFHKKCLTIQQSQDFRLQNNSLVTAWEAAAHLMLVQSLQAGFCSCFSGLRLSSLFDSKDMKSIDAMFYEDYEQEEKLINSCKFPLWFCRKA